MMSGLFRYLFKVNFYHYFNELALSVLNLKRRKGAYKLNSQSVNNLSICVKLSLQL